MATRLAVLSGGFFVLVVAAPGTRAEAASFALNEYSVRDAGLANAGGAALVGDASTVFANPAGIVRLPRAEAIVAAIAVLPRTRFANRGSLSALGAPQTGGNDKQFVDNAAVPSVFLTVPLSRRVAVGLGITAPFGITVDYDRGWVGRYQATESTIRTIDINPSLSVALTEGLSIGAGFSAQRADATLANAIDFGAVCFSVIEPVVPGTCAGAGLIPGAADGLGVAEGKDWAFGWNIGVLADLGPATRIGVHYRSGISHRLEGEGTFVVPAAAGAILPFLGGAFANSRIWTDLDLPGTLTASVRQVLTPRLTVLGTIQYTRWSALEEIRVHYVNVAQPDVVENLDYADTIRLAGGIELAVREHLTLSAGVAYDQSPTRPALETARLPDDDRMIFAGGLAWTPSDAVKVEASYQYVRLDRLSIDRAGFFGDRLTGEYRSAAHLLGVSLHVQF